MSHPNSAMHVASFAEDLVGLREFSERLLKFIEVEHHFVDGSLVIINPAIKY